MYRTSKKVTLVGLVKKLNYSLKESMYRAISYLHTLVSLGLQLTGGAERKDAKVNVNVQIFTC